MLNETSDITSAKCFMAGPARIRVQECVRSVLLLNSHVFHDISAQSGLCMRQVFVHVCWCERVCACACACVCVCVCARARVLAFTGEEIFGSGLPCYS